MSRIRIVHRTGFTYSQAATASYNEARMLPWHGDGQFVLASELSIEPGAHQHSYLDYWGTRVSTFEVLHPHTELSVTATSLVDVSAAAAARHAIGWEELAEIRESATVYVEQSRQTSRTAPPAEVERLAREIVDGCLDPGSAAAGICAAVRDRMEYMPGVTAVTSTASEAWQVGKGVCQDITHVAIGALRAVGIPARYVSGYLHPRPSAAIGETVIGESHAWLEFFSGTWVGFDPTNRIEIGERHVLVGRGRDYRDVSPLRGVYAGTKASEHFVKVEITREA
ncbi:transglutaminase family protein [Rathayibacter sp. YIM 133350]|uniref:transglutaminase family protein n=1 Tax=Rathayibacter sp. YIM 133350 TaxID=3131992 RepID=UPI00307CC879